MGKISVMIVDDSMFVFEEMKYMLTDTEFDIIGYAKSGEEAITLYEELKPDIVTLDIIMPGIDGLDTAKLILDKWPEAKIIMISSLAYDETMEQADKVGARGFLFKPIEENAILDMLRRVANGETVEIVTSPNEPENEAAKAE